MKDLIDRQTAIDAVETKIKKWNAVDGEGYHVGLGLRYTDVVEILTELPSAQPRPRGKWIDAIVADTLPVIVCDQCNTFFPLAFGASHNFCPNCGADMRQREEAHT
jgi:predicted RNA-binding Zn-ribbon protein involved in translation (DUF1610 family)